MSLLVAIDPAPTTAPKESRPAPDRFILGDPSFKSWAQDESRGNVHTGIWEATPGEETRSIKGETFEFCHILSGVVELVEDGGETRTFRAGANLVMKPGYKGVWRTIETVRKVYVVVS